jgi:hypothetical protein
MPKIGKMAQIMVQFCNPNVIRSLRRGGSSGARFFNKNPVIVLDNIATKLVSVS